MRFSLVLLFVVVLSSVSCEIRRRDDNERNSPKERRKYKQLEEESEEDQVCYKKDCQKFRNRREDRRFDNGDEIQSRKKFSKIEENNFQKPTGNSKRFKRDSEDDSHEERQTKKKNRRFDDEDAVQEKPKLKFKKRGDEESNGNLQRKIVKEKRVIKRKAPDISDEDEEELPKRKAGKQDKRVVESASEESESDESIDDDSDGEDTEEESDEEMSSKKKPMTYVKKFAHEKQKQDKKDKEAIKSIVKIHKKSGTDITGDPKRTNRDDGEDSSEEDVHPKRLHLALHDDEDE